MSLVILTEANRRSPAPASPAWVPAALSVPLTFGFTPSPDYTSQDAGGTAAGDGDGVYTWTDRSGNGHHLTQNDPLNQGTLRSVGGRWYVRLDGVSDLMAFAAPVAQALPCTLYAVLENTGGDGSNRNMLRRDGNDNPALYAGLGSPTRPGIYWSGSADGGAPGNAGVWGGDTSGRQIVRWRITSADESGVRVGGGAEVTADPPGSNLGNWVGLTSAAGGQYLGADLGDILCYQGGALTVDDDAALMAYLAETWGVTL